MVNDKDMDVISLEMKREDNLENCRVVDCEDIGAFSVREVPRARKNGGNVKKSNVYFCPGMWDVKSKKISTQISDKQWKGNLKKNTRLTFYLVENKFSVLCHQ